MDPYDKLTAGKKCVTIALAKKGFSTRKIDKKLNCQLSTVSRVIKLQHETGDIDKNNGSGRKIATSIAEDRYLKRLYLENRHVSASHLKGKQENIFSFNISEKRVYKWLTECGLLTQQPKEKPWLTQKTNGKRFAQGEKTCFMNDSRMGH